MASVTLDEGIENLKRLSALLEDTSSDLRKGADTIETFSEDLGRLEDSAEARMVRFNDLLKDGWARVDDAGGEAVEALEALAGSAHGIAEDRLRAAAEGMDAFEKAFAGRLADGRGPLENAFEDLTDPGFLGLAEAVEATQDALRAAAHETAQAHDDLVGGLQALGVPLDEVRSDVGEGMREAARRLREKEPAELAEESDTCRDVLTDELPAQLKGECAAIGEAMERFYDDCLEAARREGKDFVEAVASLIQKAVDYLTVKVPPMFAAPVARVVGDEVLAALSGEVEDALTTLTAGERALEELAAMELEVVDGLLDRVDEALDRFEP